MNEVTNTVTSEGTYDNTPISLTSNATIVKIIDGLTLVLSADKKYWKDGNLTYTIVLNNATDIKYENITLKDVIDSTYTSFVDGSVKINDAYAQSSEYNYDSSTNTLSVSLQEVEASGKTTVTFSVKKK